MESFATFFRVPFERLSQSFREEQKEVLSNSSSQKRKRYLMENYDREQKEILSQFQRRMEYYNKAHCNNHGARTLKHFYDGQDEEKREEREEEEDAQEDETNEGIRNGQKLELTNHLSSLCTNQAFNETLNRLILSHALCKTSSTNNEDPHSVLLQGVSQMAKSMGIEDASVLLDLQVYVKAQEALDGLTTPELDKKSCTAALAFCKSHASRLRRVQNTRPTVAGGISGLKSKFSGSGSNSSEAQLSAWIELELALRLQEFIELRRKNLLSEALIYAQTHFESFLLKNNSLESSMKPKDLELTEIQQAVGIAISNLVLKNPERCGVEAFERLFAPERWIDLAKRFNDTHALAYGIQSSPTLLEIILQAGLCLLKTPACTEPNPSKDLNGIENKISSYSAENCPVCGNKESVLLTKDLPRAYHAHSQLVCFVTGQRLDENNPPMVLPNGYVYGMHGIHSKLLNASPISSIDELTGEETITCPRTGDTFLYSELKNVYIL